MKVEKKLLKKVKKTDKKDKKFFSVREIEKGLNLRLKKIIKKEEYRREIAKGVVFLATFLVWFWVFNLIVNSIPTFVLNIEKAVAELILAILKGQGLDGFIEIKEIPIIELSNGISIQISYLCTGLLESLILASAILASHGISPAKRISGIIGCLILAQLFNITRIIITISFIMDSDTQTIEFVHNVFFRVTLFLVIVGLYTAWFWLATRE